MNRPETLEDYLMLYEFHVEHITLRKQLEILIAQGHTQYTADIIAEAVAPSLITCLDSIVEQRQYLLDNDGGGTGDVVPTPDPDPFPEDGSIPEELVGYVNEFIRDSIVTEKVYQQVLQAGYGWMDYLAATDVHESIERLNTHVLDIMSVLSPDDLPEVPVEPDPEPDPDPEG